ncbi:hypothetical protein V502_07221 [Pseudogymnoascus sp. VKM F-4520 (FW-2644)]|nr:hypothetical protein V502_07221 [Pseudogymnoascus sp. VKM F-4520 (FW-2644)]
MSAPQVRDALPANTTFAHVPYSPENADFKACGMPVPYNASKEWANKKVVLFSVPGAFTPTCSVSHLPGYQAALPALKAKGVDIVAVVASNDPWVMSAWAKASGVKDDSILFLSDTDTTLASAWGFAAGGRTGRWAVVIDNGKLAYVGKEEGQGVTVSGAEAVLAKL